MPDATAAIRAAAAAYEGAVESGSCNQTSYKIGKTAFLTIGPGARGVGHKAMFKLDASRAEAELLSAESPDRFGAGKSAWVTVRFSDEQPLDEGLWRRWLAESHAIASG